MVQQALRIPSVRTVPNTAAGVAVTLGEMRRLVVADRSSPIVKLAASNLVDISKRSGLPFPVYLLSWMTTYWRQQNDPFGVELVRSPSYQLQRFADVHTLLGDCDDAAVLAAGLAVAAGFRARFVAVSVDSSKIPVHVWTQILDGQWYDVDVLRPPGGGLPSVTSATYVDL